MIGPFGNLVSFGKTEEINAVRVLIVIAGINLTVVTVPNILPVCCGVLAFHAFVGGVGDVESSVSHTAPHISRNPKGLSSSGS